MEPQTLTKSQYAALCSKLAGRELLLLRVAVETAMRPTDLCRLKANDVLIVKDYVHGAGNLQPFIFYVIRGLTDDHPREPAKRLINVHLTSRTAKLLCSHLGSLQPSQSVFFTDARHRQLAKNWADLIGLQPGALTPKSIRQTKRQWKILSLPKVLNMASKLTPLTQS